MSGLKRVKRVYSIFSICLILFGLFVTVRADISIKAAYIVCGVIFIGFGITKIVGYFSKDLFQLAFQHDLAMGIMFILFGGMMLVWTEKMIRILAICIGVFMMVDALLKIQTAIDARRIGIRQWWLILLIGLSVALIGGMMFLTPFRGTRLIVRMIGMILLVDGILNLCVVQNTVGLIRKKFEEE